MQSVGVNVTVPGGRWTGDALTREFRLRPLSAEDEIEFLDYHTRAASRARTATALLARCAGISEQAAAELTVGDREALLLHLRQFTFGDLMPCVLKCPREECGEKMDLKLRMSDLLLATYPNPRPIHEAVFDGEEEGARWSVCFRLPNGSDQEAVADVARFDEKRAVELILHRCLRRSERNGAAVDKLPASVGLRISELMEALDPQAEIVLASRCPACHESFRTVFDTAACFFQEIAVRARALLGEVHLLAFFYHWSETAILALPEQRRQRYLDLVETSMRNKATI